MIPVTRTIAQGNSTSLRSLAIIVITVFAILAYILTNMNSEYSEEVQVSTILKPTSSELLPTGSATSGKLFNGREIRKFDAGELKLQDYHSNPEAISVVNSGKDQLNCSHWSVVTTIFEPSEAVKKQALLPGWCLVVVGDKKGPASYDIPNLGHNYIFLTPAKQEELIAHFPIVHLLPWNHFARKNVGYLYAIWHGAEVVWDFDDDNILIDTMMNLSNPENFVKGYTVKAVEPVNATFTSFNPYPLMGAETSPCWPRGYPLDHVKESIPKLNSINLKLSDIGIVQSLANGDPDVDAIYRLTQPIPFNFKTSKKNAYLAIPERAWSPYNAQATLHLHDALWALLLPITVHGRVSDIWRSYMAQKIGRYLGLRFLFSYATVRQDRNAHNYLADFDSERPLYLEATKLIEQLDDWELTSASIPGKIEQLWVLMYEHGYIEIEDVRMCQAWLQSLIAAGYDFTFKNRSGMVADHAKKSRESAAAQAVEAAAISEGLGRKLLLRNGDATKHRPLHRAHMGNSNGEINAMLQEYRQRPFAPSQNLF